MPDSTPKTTREILEEMVRAGMTDDEIMAALRPEIERSAREYVDAATKEPTP